VNKTFNILFILLLSAYLGYKLYLNSNVSKGKKVAEIEGVLPNGDAFKLSQLEGNYVLVDFWGSWCAPCRRDNPKLVGLYDKYENSAFENANRFEIVNVAIEKNENRIHKTIIKDGLRWPYHIIQTSKLVLSSPLALSYGVTDLPTKFLIGPDGILIGRNMSFEEIDAYLAQRLKT